MSEKLKQLNCADDEAAAALFLDCCGSRRWANLMVKARPFKDVGGLLKQAEIIWQDLETRDWLEAFAAHPKIGARQPVPAQTAKSGKWSQTEQSGARHANDFVLNELAEVNRLYEEKFGYIFIVCATGKSAEEMLSLCRERMNNPADVELRLAADEQKKITEIRLKKLLNSEIA